MLNFKGDDSQDLQRATFAAGCFWGIEASFRETEGVVKTSVGYTGGNTVDPTYEQVCSDTTGHAEAVEVWFAPAIVSYDELLNVFWSIHDPTTRNRQGWDFGSQYRSAIFFHDAEQETLAIASRDRHQASSSKQIVTQIVAAVVRPRTAPCAWRIAPAPRNPMPDTICAAMRVVSPYGRPSGVNPIWAR